MAQRARSHRHVRHELALVLVVGLHARLEGNGDRRIALEVVEIEVVEDVCTLPREDAGMNKVREGTGLTYQL
jgi:hypothetical protein